MLLENIKNIKQIGGGFGNFFLFLIFGAILFFGIWALMIQAKKDTCLNNVKNKWVKDKTEQEGSYKPQELVDYSNEIKKKFGLDDINPFNWTNDNFNKCINEYQVDDIIKN